jgi:hypothetical protein
MACVFDRTASHLSAIESLRHGWASNAGLVQTTGRIRKALMKILGEVILLCDEHHPDKHYFEQHTSQRSSLIVFRS